MFLDFEGMDASIHPHLLLNLVRLEMTISKDSLSDSTARKKVKLLPESYTDSDEFRFAYSHISVDGKLYNFSEAEVFLDNFSTMFVKIFKEVYSSEQQA